MLCSADSGLCPLHIPSQPLRAMPGRTSCLRYPGLWESWCHYYACGYLWWLEGCGHAISCTSPNPLLLSSCQVRLCCTCRTFRCTFCHLFLLTLGVVPDRRASNLHRTPSLPSPAWFERPAAAPRREFWLPVIVRHALTLAVPRSLSPPWPFCRRAPLTLSGSSMRTSLAAAMRTSSSMSGAALRRWGQRPCQTAKMDRRWRVKNRSVDLASN